ncbi:MAG: hypothetical protein ACFFCO_04430 [Promethearchaeota archaeon]
MGPPDIPVCEKCGTPLEKVDSAKRRATRGKAKPAVYKCPACGWLFRVHIKTAKTSPTRKPKLK